MLTLKFRKSFNFEIAQTEEYGLGDLILSGILAFSVMICAIAWQYPGTYPGSWNEVAVASGIRPAASILPGYFRFFGMVVYGIFGISAGNMVLKILGHLALSLVTMGAYAVLHELLVFVMRARPQYSIRRFIVMRLASALGALAFAFSEPVWVAGQFFSETTLMLILVLGALDIFFVFLRKGELRYSYYCAILLGLIAAESPLGFFILIAFITINSIVLKHFPVYESPFYNPALIAVGKWYMTFIFIFAVLFGVTLNIVTFICDSGMVATGIGGEGLPLGYLLAYWGRLTQATGFSGWGLLAGVAVLPFVVSLMKFPSASDEEMFLPYSTGFVFLICTLLALAQSAFIPSLWFWTYGPVSSGILHCCAMLLSAGTLACGMVILGVDTLCRNHRRLAGQMFGVRERFKARTRGKFRSAEELGQSRSTTAIRRAGMIIVPLFVIALMIPGRIKSGSRRMLQIIEEGVAEIVQEAGNAKFLFTDGNLDPAVELESHARGGDLVCLSLMGKGNSYDAYLRTRGMWADAEDRMTFGFDCGTGLKTWLRDKPERLKDCAIQVGFDLWKRDGKALPSMGGVLSRPAGWANDSERANGISFAHALAKRILTACGSGAVRHCPDKSIFEAFAAVQWRLARMCIYRGEKLDLEGDAPSAIAEVKLAKDLNALNRVYSRMMEALTESNEQLMKRLTPREGLQLALVRADFVMGRTYAETILSVDPQDADSNFAMGMYYLKVSQYARSEEYLKRCLVRNSGEPAIYNNLALVQMKLAKFDAALINIDKAVQMLPQSAEVLDSKKTILKAYDEYRERTGQDEKKGKQR